MCLKIEKQRIMRIVHGLELRIVPAGIFSRATGPLVNAALNLEHQDVVVSMCWVSIPSASDHTTMSVRVMIGMGIGEKCSCSTTPISSLSRNQVVLITRWMMGWRYGPRPVR